MLLAATSAVVIAGSVRASGTRHRRAADARARDTIVTEHQLSQGVVRRALSDDVAQSVAPAELRRRVAALAPGTYVDDVLAMQDSVLYRWPDRLHDALRVYVAPGSSAVGWRPEYPELARTVFDEWSEAGFPLRFTFVFDSVGADLLIGWRDRFPPEDGQRIGVTERVQTSTFLIARARISIATQDSAGRTLPPAVVGGIVRHEVGHALGLNHTNDPTSVMYHEAATARISASDRATLHMIYLVPGGSLRDR